MMMMNEMTNHDDNAHGECNVEVVVVMAAMVAMMMKKTEKTHPGRMMVMNSQETAKMSSQAKKDKKVYPWLFA